MRHAEAKRIAELWLADIGPMCERVEIAGSVRRGKPEVKDIDILCIRRKTEYHNMFGDLVGYRNDLDPYLESLAGLGVIRLLKNGPRYKQIHYVAGDIKIELWTMEPPAQWGVQFLIRTGPAEFGHRFVTHKALGGLLPGYLRVKDGAIWSHNHIVETPEEQDVFDLIGLPYIPPEERTG